MLDRSELLTLLLAAREIDDSGVRAMYVEQLISVLEQQAPGLAAFGVQFAALALTDEGTAAVISGANRRVSPYAGEPLEGEALADPNLIPVDVLIVTIKQPELAGCLAAFDLDEEDDTRWAGETTEFRYWSAEHDDVRYAISNVGQEGNIFTTLRMIEFGRVFAPKLAILVGTAAGVEGKIREGDVVLANMVYNYEFARWTTAGLASAALPYRPELRNVDPFRSEASLKRWNDTIDAKLPDLRDLWNGEDEFPEEEWLARRPFKLKVEPIMSGGWLIESENLPPYARSIHESIVATEMEGAGFAAAADHQNWHWYVVRGISDLADTDRTQKIQRLASFNSALYVRDMLVPILRKNGRVPR